MSNSFRPESDGSLTILSNGVDMMNLTEFTLDEMTMRVYTADATWTKPDGLKYVVVEVIGAGGGGSTRGTQGKTTIAGAGGGGGGYSRKRILAASLGATETVTVGIGGTASKTGSTNTDGSTGGTSSFGSHCSANGGGGGQKYDGVAPATTLSVGGSGGTATGGDVNVTGSKAADNSSANGLDGAVPALGFGSGGAGARTTSTAIVNNSNGNLYGGGGGGGFTTGTNNAGSGADGIVIVYEFFN